MTTVEKSKNFICSIVFTSAPNNSQIISEKKNNKTNVETWCAHRKILRLKFKLS